MKNVFVILGAIGIILNILLRLFTLFLSFVLLINDFLRLIPFQFLGVIYDVFYRPGLMDIIMDISAIVLYISILLIAFGLYKEK